MKFEQKNQTQSKLYFKSLIKRCQYCQETGHLWKQTLKLKRSVEQHRKEFGTSRRLYCNCFGGIYRKKPVVVDSSVTLLKQDLGNQFFKINTSQRQRLPQNYLERLEKNYKKMEEQFFELIEEKEELSRFEIDLDEDMYQ